MSKRRPGAFPWAFSCALTFVPLRCPPPEPPTTDAGEVGASDASVEVGSPDASFEAGGPDGSVEAACDGCIDAPTTEGGAPRVVEPLLGCSIPPPDAPPSGTLQLFDAPTFVDPATGETLAYGGLLWSGNNAWTATVLRGVDRTDPENEVETARVARWSPIAGWTVVTPTILDRGIGASAKMSCDGSVVAGHLPDRSIYRWDQGALQLRPDESTDRTLIELSQDGSTLIWNETHFGSPFNYPIVWSQTGGGGSGLQRNDDVFTLSYDGRMVFGYARDCSVDPDCPEAVFRSDLEGRTFLPGAPIAPVSADGSTFVLPPPPEGTPPRIALWRDGVEEQIACPAAPCSVMAMSSRARILLVKVADETMVWTAAHGFRTLASLVPTDGWTLSVANMSLDGRSFAGSASRGGETRLFRATVRSDAYD